MNYFKKAVALLSLMAGTYSFSASAQFTRCEIDTSVQSFDLGIEIGGGTGIATCWDNSGNEFVAPLTVALDTGIGIQIGMCQVAAHYTAVGVGFALDSILGVMPQIQLAPGTGNGAAAGVDLNPFGINAMLTLSNINVQNCAKIADVNGQVITRSGPIQSIQQLR